MNAKKISVLFAISFFININLIAQTYEKQVDATPFFSDQITSSCNRANGNLLAVVAGNSGSILMELTPLGDTVWTRKIARYISPGGGCWLTSVAERPDGNIVVAGSVYRYAWAGLYNNNATTRIAEINFKQLDNAQITTIAIGSDNSVYFGGYDYAFFSGGSTSYSWAPPFVGKINAGFSGVQWRTTFGDHTNFTKVNGAFKSLALDATGNIIATGCIEDNKLFVCKMDPAGNVLWKKQRINEPIILAFGSKVVAAPNNYIYVAYTSLNRITTTSSRDIVVSKLSPNGDTVWTKALGSPATDVLDHVASINYNKLTHEIDILGYYDNNASIQRATLMRIDTNATILDYRRFDDITSMNATSILQTSYNKLFITGVEYIMQTDLNGTSTCPSTTIPAVSVNTVSGYVTGANASSHGGGSSFVSDYTTSLTYTSATTCYNCTTPSTPGIISGSTIVCMGSVNVYSVTPVSGAASYTWSLPSGWSGTSTTNSISITSGTSGGNISVTANNACGSSSLQTLAVSISTPNVTANATDDNLCNGESTILTGGGASSYTWTSGVTDGVSFVPSSTTTYTVTGTDVNSCSNTNTITITVNNLPTVTANTTDDILCDGESTILTGGGASSYTWTGGVNDGVSFVPSTTTTYTVTGTDVNSCSNTATITVTVNNLPTVTANATDDILCNGESTILTGGGASSYTWTGGVTDGVSFTPIATTTYTVTGTDANSCTNTNTIIITVNNLPTVTANATDDILCNGESTILTGSGASSYTWTGGVTDGVSFVPSTTATYTVTGTDVNTCSNTNTIIITVNNLPTVTANATDDILCDGESTILTGGGASSYTWTGGVTDGTSFTPSATATYTVTGTDGNTCSNTATITVTVNSLPAVIFSYPGNDTICITSGIQVLSGGSPSGGNYSGTGVSGVNFDPNIAGIGSHTITYLFTDVNSCSNNTSVDIVVLGCAGIESEENLMIEVYPNPFTSLLTVKGLEQGTHIKLYNSIGEIVGNWILIESITSIHTEELSAGVYFLHIYTSKGIITKKILKQ